MIQSHSGCRAFFNTLIFAVAICAVSADPSIAQPSNGSLLLTHARVLDERGEAWLNDHSILIENHRISAIAPDGKIRMPANCKSIDLARACVLPGLIDLHTHLLLHPYNEAPWDDQVLKESLEFRTIRATTAARATLESGFTTIRELGTEGGAYADVALRDAIASGLIPGPRIFAVTRAIVATGCYGPQSLDRRWDGPRGAEEATGVDEVRRIVRRQIAAGADWIKFYADYHRRSGAPVTATFSEEEMLAIVDEAHTAGLKVAAHAGSAEGIRRAVVAGVSTIEHGYEAKDEVLITMRDRKVVLCPTLAAVEAYETYEGWKPGQQEPERLRQAKDTFRRALKIGVPIACGSDAGVFPHGANAREIELMVECGMTPAQSIRAATISAAAVLDRQSDLGRLSAGFIADLIVVRDDPLRAVSSLRMPIMVIANGRIAVDRR